MRASPSVRARVVATAHLLAERGWVANHDGNITLRVADNRFLATPTATHKRLVADNNLIEVDRTGRRLAGTARRFSELNLHMAVYEGRDDVNAVVHAHPPHATAIACSAHNPIERPFMPEAVVSIGASIPKVPFAPPGDQAKSALASVVEYVDAAMLQNHGVIAWGADLEQAYLRLELVEHLARIALLAVPMGGVRPLADEVVGPLLRKRAGANLGLAAQNATKTPLPNSSAPLSGDRDDLPRLIRDELLRAMRERP